MIRRLLAALVLALLPATAQAQWGAPDQSDTDLGGLWGTDGIHSATGLTADCTAGDFVVVVTAMQPSTQTITSIDDAGTTVYALAHREVDATRNNVIEIWWGLCAGTDAGQTLEVTANAATSFANALFGIAEFAVVGGADADQAGEQSTGAGASTATSLDTGNVTPSTTNNLVIGVSIGSSTTTAYGVDADFTGILGADVRRTFAYRTQTSATALSYTITTGNGGADTEDMTAAIVAFEEAGGGAPASTSRRKMMGCCE